MNQTYAPESPPVAAAPVNHQALLDKVFDALGIGAFARTEATLLTNLSNLRRRADCLNAVENAFFPEPEDEAVEDLAEVVLLAPSWGAGPAEYLAQFQEALRESPLLPRGAKDHEVAQAVNQLRSVAVEFHAAQQLRARISDIVVPLVALGRPQPQSLLTKNQGRPHAAAPAAVQPAVPISPIVASPATNLPPEARAQVLSELAVELRRVSTENSAQMVEYMRDHDPRFQGATREALLEVVATRFDVEQLYLSCSATRDFAERTRESHPAKSAEEFPAELADG